MAGLMQSWFMPKKDPKPYKTPPTPPHSTITGASYVGDNTSVDDFQKKQQAYYQQLLSGTGQIAQGGALPEGVQSNIDRQAALI